MSFDYINDLFGKFRKNKKTKYTDLEKRAASLLRDYYEHRISADEFGNAMWEVSDELKKLMYDPERDTYAFDENTPLWLNSFLGYKFLTWDRFRKAYDMAKNNPECTSDPSWPEIEMNRASQEDALMNAIEYCLNEL
jgi:hypothetical protein